MGQPIIHVPLIRRGRHRVESGNIIPGDLKKKVFYPPTKQLAWPLQSVEAMHTVRFSKKNTNRGLPFMIDAKCFKTFHQIVFDYLYLVQIIWIKLFVFTFSDQFHWMSFFWIKLLGSMYCEK